MQIFRTIAGAGEAEIIIKKSRFIGRAIPAPREEEALSFVNGLKKQHWDATHNCHAYIIDVHCMRSGDDGEPAGTAGRPMLEVLRSEGLEQVAVVVTRYFGGILLGTGGLVRAYSQAAKAALDAAGMGRQIVFGKLHLTMDYSLYGKVESVLAEKGYAILDSDFSDVVQIAAGLPREQIEPLRALLVDLTHGQISLTVGEEYHQFVRGI